MSSTTTTDLLSSTTTLRVAGTLAVTALVFLLRALKRSQSPTISAKWSCACRTVQGTICAKRQDSIRLHCYCQDCRDYANFIAALGASNNNNGKGNNKDGTSSMVYPCGETHLVQVCKSAVSIQKGMDHLQLARKESPNTGMFRYYASCCHTPIMNTVDFLGYVGVFEDNLLDAAQREKFSSPVCHATAEALKTPLEVVVPGVNGFHFLWNLARYQMYAKKGPFDYTLKPIFWGETKKQE